MELIQRYKSFGGWVEFYRHNARTTQTEMKFSVFRPPQAEHVKVPVLYWLSGLTCTEENFITKAGAQPYAAEHGILLVAPDTSPRGAGIEGEDESWDLGTGAGFYVNATQPKWEQHYRMYEYVSEELPALVNERLPVQADREGIFGHSMGGHGALVLALRQPGRYRSVSAFSPIVAPTLCPWGQKVFTNYLGEDRDLWVQYDAHLLIARAKQKLPILIDQGMEDKFLREQLMPERLEEACRAHDYPLILRRQEGYDHSYYFIASFMRDHIDYHARALVR